MHDIDTTRLELNPEFESNPEMESGRGTNGEAQFETPLTEAEEEALAAELLGVSNEAEMDHFLGGLFRKLTQKIGGAAKFLAKNAGPLAGALKGIAGQALPFLGGALGSVIPIPGVGTALGSALGKAASNLLQGELEQLEAEDQEFELARRFVRLAGSSVRHGARRPYYGSPSAAVNLALRQALNRWRRWPGYYSRRWYGGYYPQYPQYRQYSQYSQYPQYPQYQQCPPCPPCPAPGPGPTLAASPPAPEGGGPEMSPGAPPPEAPAAPAKNPEFEFGMAGEGEFEGQGEAENYESYYGYPTVSPSYGGRSGRWVRRGRKIVIYGL
jgi:hypothetical protein